MRVDDTRREELKERELSVRIREESLKIRKLNAARFAVMKENERQRQSLSSVKTESQNTKGAFVSSVVGARHRLQISSRKVRLTGQELKSLEVEVKTAGEALNGKLKKVKVLREIVQGKKQLMSFRRTSKAQSEQIESFVQRRNISSKEGEPEVLAIRYKEEGGRPRKEQELELSPQKSLTLPQESQPAAESVCKAPLPGAERYMNEQSDQSRNESREEDSAKSPTPDRERALQGLKERIEELKAWSRHDAQGVAVSYVLKNGKKVQVEVSCRAGKQFDVVVSCSGNKKSVLSEKAAILAFMRQAGVEVKSFVMR